MHGQVEAAPQFLHVLNRLQTLSSLFGQSLDIRNQQISIGLVMASTHTAAQLMQLSQAELVGPTDHDGVGRGDIDAGFDDGRAQE